MRHDATRWTTVAAGLTRLYIAFGFGLWALIAHFLHRAPPPNELQKDALGVAAPLLGAVACVLLVYGAVLCARAPDGWWLRPLAIAAATLGTLWGIATLLRRLPFAEEWPLDEAHASVSFALALVLLGFLLQLIRCASTPETVGRRGVLLQWWLTLALSIAALATWIVGPHVGFTKLWFYVLSGTGAGGVFLFSLLVVSVRRLVADDNAPSRS